MCVLVTAAVAIPHLYCHPSDVVMQPPVSSRFPHPTQCAPLSTSCASIHGQCCTQYVSELEPIVTLRHAYCDFFSCDVCDTLDVSA